jgi:hypothetical protein
MFMHDHSPHQIVNAPGELNRWLGEFNEKKHITAKKIMGDIHGLGKI